MPASEREFKVFKIQNGTVIDHIPYWKAIEVVELLGLRSEVSRRAALAHSGSTMVTIGIGLNSGKMGKKDLLKIEGRDLSESEIDRLALVAPDATINLIRDSQRVNKLNVKLPDRIDRIVRCSNVGCITRHEDVPTRFMTISRTPVQLRCHYCSWITQGEDIELL